MPDPAIAVPGSDLTGPVPRVLFLSRIYPSSAVPRLGLWVEGLAVHGAALRECQVVAPVPFCPNLPFLPHDIRRHRSVPPREVRNGLIVHHPRIPTLPTARARPVEAALYFAGIVDCVDRVRESFPFDVIHAHFTHPDGWVAARLASRYDIPFVITEHASWRAWAAHSPLVLRQAREAMRACTFHVSVGTALRDEMAYHADAPAKLRIIPCDVDGDVFALPGADVRPAAHQVLFVGAVRHVKGVDVLLHAMRKLADEGRQDHLLIVGDAYFRAYARDEARVRALALELGIADRISFAAGMAHPEIARLMQQSAVLVLPSRRETLGMVLVEALACGTPVVATDCGGPADIVIPGAGLLVPLEDPAALAGAIARVVDRRAEYDPARLRASVVPKFSKENVAEQYGNLYSQAIVAHRHALRNRGQSGKRSRADAATTRLSEHAPG